MSYRIDFRPEAEKDLHDASDWYKTRAPGLGKEFLDRVDEALETISQFPHASAVVHRDVRRHLLERFPHSILYVVEPAQIIVLAVYHGRRDPADWKDRR